MPSMAESEKEEFMSKWVRTHIDDGAGTLKKPVLFAEFGKSRNVAGYTESVRVSAMSAMFDAIYDSAVAGGAGAGALVWQLITNTTTALADGFEIALSSDPNIASLMQQQASRLSSLSH
jgi:mannan endo-1,4-beta-mannosidase